MANPMDPTISGAPGTTGSAAAAVDLASEFAAERDCLYTVCALTASPDGSPESMLKGVVETIPSGWARPGVACARIVYRERIVVSAGFTEREQRLSCPLRVQGEPVGAVEAHIQPGDGALSRPEDKQRLLAAVALHVQTWFVRRQVEAGLRESEQTLDAMFRAAPIGLAIAQDRFIQWANAAMCEMLGFAEGTLVGQDARVLYEDAEEYDRVGRELYGPDGKSGPGCTETRWRRRDGQMFDCFLRVKAVDDRADHRCFVVAAVDVSDRRRHEQAIREVQGQQKAILDNIPDVAWLKDRAGRFVAVNDPFLQACGHGQDNVLGQTDHDFWPADLATRYTEDDQEVMRTGKRMKVEEPFEDVRGVRTIIETIKTPVYDETGELLGTTGIARDITERRNVEEELRRLVTVIEQGAVEVFITDPEGIISYVNPAFERMTGYARDEVIGKSPRILRSGAHDPEFYEKLWATIAGGEVWRGRLVDRRKDGSLYEKNATISSVRDDLGRVASYVSVSADVSREVELARQLRQAQKMEAIGTLAGGIAHDFNNILGAIMGYAEMASEELPAGSKPIHQLNEVLRASGRARDLVKQILAFSRPEKGDHEPMDFIALLRDAWALLRASTPTTIEMRCHVSCASARIEGSPSQIHQMLVNLGANAVSAMRERGGVLTATVDVLELSDRKPGEWAGVKPGSYVKFTIEDTGCGMSAEQKERMFDPFFTTRKPGEGTGMGLPVVHGIVKAHRGGIHVESEVGRGTRIAVALPRVESSEENQAEASFVRAPGPGVRVLFVDDEAMLVQIARETLISLGHRPTVFGRGTEALAAFRQAPHEFDLVITDQTMPGVTGMQLARELRDVRPDIPVILCTGFSEAVTEENLAAAGIRRLLLKPVGRAQMEQAIQDVLDGQRPSP